MKFTVTGTVACLADMCSSHEVPLPLLNFKFANVKLIFPLQSTEASSSCLYFVHIMHSERRMQVCCFNFAGKEADHEEFKGPCDGSCEV